MLVSTQWGADLSIMFFIQSIMNYKLNRLNTSIVCEEILIQDFPSLKFGETPDKVVVFDATEYCNAEELNQLNHAAFGVSCRIFIDRMLKNKNLTPSNLFFMTADNHLLMNKGLTYIFLMFVSPDVNDYFFGLIDEILSHGIAISDSYLASMVDERIPSEYLQAIIDTRREADHAE